MFYESILTGFLLQSYIFAFNYSIFLNITEYIFRNIYIGIYIPYYLTFYKKNTLFKTTIWMYYIFYNFNPLDKKFFELFNFYTSQLSFIHFIIIILYYNYFYNIYRNNIINNQINKFYNQLKSDNESDNLSENSEENSEKSE